MRQVVESIVLDALRLANRSRPVEKHLPVHSDALLFGEGASLDSLSLVALVIDIEDALHERGLRVDLSDAQALSQRRSPFRSVATLVDYVILRLDQNG